MEIYPMAQTPSEAIAALLYQGKCYAAHEGKGNRKGGEDSKPWRD